MGDGGFYEKFGFHTVGEFTTDTKQVDMMVD